MPGGRFAWRDNGWLFAAGAAILSLPVTVMAINAISGHGLSAVWNNPFAWMATGSGSLGMFIAGKLAYEKTRNSGLFVERAALIVGNMVGLSFLIASVPFVVFGGIGMLFALIAGAVMLGLPAFAFAVVWTLLFLGVAGPSSRERSGRSIREAADPHVPWHTGWCSLTVICLIFAIALTLKRF